MKRNTILSTDPVAAESANFVHGEVSYTFGLLTLGGPQLLVEGESWAFVDWVMAELSGLEMCRRLRADARTKNCHITIMLEQDEPDDRRRALRAGADDYAIGPLNRQAMLDRVLALNGSDHRRAPVQTFDFGDLQINISGEQAHWQNAAIRLMPNEFRVLRFMAENANRVLSRTELIEGLGKAGDPDYLRTVDVWVKRLRSGLRKAGCGHLLRTVHGKGYVLDLD